MQLGRLAPPLPLQVSDEASQNIDQGFVARIAEEAFMLDNRLRVGHWRVFLHAIDQIIAVVVFSHQRPPNWLGSAALPLHRRSVPTRARSMLRVPTPKRLEAFAA